MTDRIFLRRGERDAELQHLLLEEAVRDLDEDAAAVAELGIGPDRAAVVEIEQDLQAHLDDLMARLIVELGHEADAAGIMLLGRVIEALSRRQQRIASKRGGSGERGIGGKMGVTRHVASILRVLSGAAAARGRDAFTPPGACGGGRRPRAMQEWRLGERALGLLARQAQFCQI